MKRLITTHISPTAGLPFSKPVLDHLQSEIFESDAILGWSMLNGVNAAPTIMFGVDPVLSGTTLSWGFGAISYNGDIYIIDSGSVTGTPTFVLNILTTYEDGAGTTYTDGSVFQTLQTKKMTFVSGASGSGIANWDAIGYLHPKWKTSTSTSGTTITNPSGSALLSVSRTWIEDYRSVTMNYRVAAATSGTDFVFINLALPVNAKAGTVDYGSAAINLPNATAGIIANTDPTNQKLALIGLNLVTSADILISGSITYQKA